MTADRHRVVPLILCGGTGTRLWPMSRAARPKQFLPLTGSEGPFQMTLRRLAQTDRYAAPITARRLARKSYLRSYLQYRTFVGERLYRDNYGMRSNLLVLNVMNDPGQQRVYMQLVTEHAPEGNSFMLFQAIEGFGAVLTPPPPMLDLFDRPWERVGQPPLNLRTGSACGERANPNRLPVLNR